jgi:hypothetical protein
VIDTNTAEKAVGVGGLGLKQHGTATFTAKKAVRSRVECCAASIV